MMSQHTSPNRRTRLEERKREYAVDAGGLCHGRLVQEIGKSVYEYKNVVMFVNHYRGDGRTRVPGGTSRQRTKRR